MAVWALLLELAFNDLLLIGDRREKALWDSQKDSKVQYQPNEAAKSESQVTLAGVYVETMRNSWLVYDLPLCRYHSHNHMKQ